MYDKDPSRLRVAVGGAFGALAVCAIGYAFIRFAVALHGGA